MSTSDAYHSRSLPPSGGGFLVPQPGSMLTVGSALHQAFDSPSSVVPDEWALLLDRLDAKTSHFDGE